MTGTAKSGAEDIDEGIFGKEDSLKAGIDFFVKLYAAQLKIALNDQYQEATFCKPRDPVDTYLQCPRTRRRASR